MDIRQVGRAIRSNVVVFAAVFLFCALVGGLAAYVPANKYQANNLLLADPVPNVDPASAVASVQYFLPQLALEAQESAELKKVAQQVPAQFANVAVTVTANPDPETGTITVTGTSKDPAAAAAFVNTDARLMTALQKNNGVFTLIDPFPAQVPATPSNPRKEILFGSIVFGVIAAVFGALGADAIRRRLSQVEETRSRIGLPVLAEVPRMGRHALHPAEVFSRGAHPLILEAFQELRSNLLLALPDDGPAAIAVISGESGEGKSSVAADLAWALASESRQVTLVDCDLRKPTVHEILGTASGPGLSGRRSLDLGHLVCATDNPYLNVVPAGIPDRHPVDVISAFLPPLISDLKSEGRHIIVDCPPLNGVAETLLLASVVDVVVFVIDARHFDPGHVQQYQARLHEAGAVVIGVVLNRVRMGAKRWDRSHDYAVPEISSDDRSNTRPTPQHQKNATPTPVVRRVG
jgi:succinoglycan biosynthesis transport protein ExoP